ncbi:FAD-binding protein [Vitiosangium sp. GDMCC 1.1324]|uniref:FAD-binding protein n=1 Tax=Vitiosangium sp. (strain GDMCC 1.1324) TaxID=2138576 RepID=UPI00130D9055|nr:FAD-binding protein [Vitiosangium sp. GDMCC 1.1324]
MSKTSPLWPVTQPSPVLEPAGSNGADEAEWRLLRTRARFYGGMTLAAVLLSSVALAHPVLFGFRVFTTCASPGCIWAFHYIEVPFFAAITIAALHTLFGFSRATLHRAPLIIGFANLAELTFFALESVLIIDSLQRGAPASETLIYAIAAFLLLAGATLGFRLQLRIIDHLHPPVDPRFEHPRTEGEIIQLVKKARAYGVQLRVRGSGHCRPRQGTHTDKGAQHINVQLDRYNHIIAWDDVRRRVTVQGGCHLGVDPHDPLSNKKNSLLWQLDQRGWALPDLGGISHQTVAGFMSTGSMGGTLHHDLGEAIVGLRIIDGTGEVYDLAPNPDDPDDAQNNPFYAVGVSMGLLGVISAVTFQCEPRYAIVGKQVTSGTGKCSIALFDAGVKGLKSYCEKNDGGDTYTRLLWWPQKGVDKVELWAAHRDEEAHTPRLSFRKRFKRRPFVSVPRVLQWLFINPFFNFIAEDGLPFEGRTEKLVRRVLNLFLRDGEETFQDFWFRALPMDDQISDRQMPTVFSELFIDITQADKVMALLQEYFNPRSDETEALTDAQGMNRTGAYAFEVYPGCRSPFWMSPSYGRDSIRLDVFWFRAAADRKTREAFFERFWNLLREAGIDFRAHWGKYLPPPGSKAGADYLRSQYPMWDRFLELRRRMDPQDLFLTTYWKEHLGLAAPAPELQVASIVAEQRSGVRKKTAALRVATQRRVRRGRLYLSLVVLQWVFGLSDWIRGRSDETDDSTTTRGVPGPRPVESARA